MYELWNLRLMRHCLYFTAKIPMFGFLIRGEACIHCGSAAVIRICNPRPIPYENNLPCGSVARYVDRPSLRVCINRRRERPQRSSL